MDGHGDQFHVGGRLALVCDNDPQEQSALQSALSELGFRIDVAANAQDAIDKFTADDYQVIVLDEAFDGSTPEANEVLKTLQVMPMASRRSIVLAFVGADVPTGDRMAAFARSVNVVIAKRDLGQITAILQAAIAEHQQFFRVFYECLHEAGRVA